jgi:putative membrane protein
LRRRQRLGEREQRSRQRAVEEGLRVLRGEWPREQLAHEGRGGRRRRAVAQHVVDHLQGLGFDARLERALHGRQRGASPSSRTAGNRRLSKLAVAARGPVEVPRLEESCPINDPRVFFAASATLPPGTVSASRSWLSATFWSFGLFLHLFAAGGDAGLTRGPSFWIGIAFILLGSGSAAAAVFEFRGVLRTLKPAEIPQGYRINAGVVTNLLVGLFGVALCAYLFWESVT